MGCIRIYVEVRRCMFDCAHLPETQACVHIEHPALSEPLDLQVPEVRAESYDHFWWDEIVEHALDRWLQYTWLSPQRARVAAFKDLLAENEDIRADFRRACASERLRDCEAKMEHLRKEAGELQGFLSSSPRS